MGKSLNKGATPLSVTTNQRSGPFWDAVEGRVPLPRAAASLGFQFVNADVDNGTIEVAFAGTDEFTNPFGEVMGAFLAAMLYDTLGPALLATLKPTQFITTLDLSTRFLRPVRPGRIVGRGRVAHRDGDLAFLEASLHGHRGGDHRDWDRHRQGDRLAPACVSWPAFSHRGEGQCAPVSCPRHARTRRTGSPRSASVGNWAALGRRCWPFSTPSPASTGLWAARRCCPPLAARPRTSRGTAARRPLALGLASAGLKIAGGFLALGLAFPSRHGLPQRLLRVLAAVASVVLVLYGGVLVVVGALVLTDVIDPGTAVDRTALRWHVFLWDAWFLIWGLLLGRAAYVRQPSLTAPARRWQPLETYEAQWWRALAVFRAVSLLYAAVLYLRVFDDYRHPAGGWLVLAAMAVWTVVTIVAYRDPRLRRWPLLTLDLLTAAAAVVVTRWLQEPDWVERGAQTLPVTWVAAPVIAWAIVYGWPAALPAAAVVGLANVLERGAVTDALLHNTMLVLLAGALVGYVAERGRLAEAQLAAALEVQAAARERDRLARAVHDGTLQVLSLVARRGDELDRDGAELARLAGEQEIALRTLLSGRPLGEVDPAGMRDLTEAVAPAGIVEGDHLILRRAGAATGR